MRQHFSKKEDMSHHPHGQSPQKKTLSTEEVNALGERLSRRQRKPVQLAPLHEKKKIDAETMDRSLQRLYTQSVEHKKKMLEDLDRKAHPDMVKHHTLDQEALEGMFGRLYTQSMGHKEITQKKLEKKYIPQQEKKVLSKSQVSESAQRLCNGSMEHAREKHAELYQKYVESTKPKTTKMTPEEIAESASRLCASPGRN